MLKLPAHAILTSSHLSNVILSSGRRFSNELMNVSRSSSSFAANANRSCSVIFLFEVSIAFCFVSQGEPIESNRAATTTIRRYDREDVHMDFDELFKILRCDIILESIKFFNKSIVISLNAAAQDKIIQNFVSRLDIEAIAARPQPLHEQKFCFLCK